MKEVVKLLGQVLLTLHVLQSCDQLPEISAGLSNSTFNKGS
jgi:hypothetical protein